MPLYTRGGDDGRTSLMDGTRVSKDDSHVTACGDLDELNSLLGWCRCAGAGPELDGRIEQIQRELFAAGAELATPAAAARRPGIGLVGAVHGRRLESWIDEACAATAPLANFVLPGGCELAARLHVARTCCRRAERSVVHLGQTEPVRGEVVVYLNRLGDLLFAWARLANRQAGAPDVLWIPSP